MLHKASNRLLTKLFAIGAIIALASIHVAQAQSTGSGLIPCDGPDCDVNSVMQLINNLINFFFRTLLVPIFVIMIMYLGFGYITAGGKPGQHAKLASMAKHMVLGLVLILCAFFIVKVILSILGYHDTFNFFGNS
ncbi:MAG TPA: hypothetical protein VL576_01500 [Candidatus Paceibacterota bacterium]|jgi:hypothetical protein|nr:hypothetical protein [Candidatus Paceibacterota bacterium]